ncbi:MAG: hypothetical protein COX70_06280 [Flavobacteriales bacterium CG_4_10_14_0_2_um_filter_32_8]|nr:MAG: hypothetical protein COX70_06280 [Flavobacteriales bacterium CG_4_10_14_0_2_um_filter_32_8]PJB14223.1 MAG: hypothetical protein CO118_09720 [Flavobacteriales bacterium CG_4_9_14_3_um_filter_32_8]
MIKDINHPIIKNVAVAVVKEKNEINTTVWNVYIINQQSQTIENVLISSKGYITDLKGEESKTSILRHYLGDIRSKEYKLIEPVIEEVFALHNEYWVSFYLNQELFDKKYIFLAETIKDENLINIPIINKLGVMIK